MIRCSGKIERVGQKTVYLKGGVYTEFIYHCNLCGKTAVALYPEHCLEELRDHKQKSRK